MGGKYGTAELERMLKQIENMTDEEYNALHERAKKSIEEIESGVADYRVFIYHDPKTEMRFHIEYSASQNTVSISARLDRE